MDCGYSLELPRRGKCFDGEIKKQHSGTRLFIDDSLLFRQIKDQADAELLQQDLHFW